MIHTKTGTTFEKKDYEQIIALYNKWKAYNNFLKKFNTRGCNIPEQLTESIICYLFGYKRIKGSKGDAIDCKGNKIEIKATSIKKDCTSFSPKKPYWKSFYFLDFFEHDKTNSFKIYNLSSIDFDKIQVSRRDTFKQQRKKGRRPRFSIKPIINEKRIVYAVIQIKDICKYFKPFPESFK